MFKNSGSFFEKWTFIWLDILRQWPHPSKLVHRRRLIFSIQQRRPSSSPSSIFTSAFDPWRFDALLPPPANNRSTNAQALCRNMDFYLLNIPRQQWPHPNNLVHRRRVRSAPGKDNHLALHRNLYQCMWSMAIWWTSLPPPMWWERTTRRWDKCKWGEESDSWCCVSRFGSA